MLNSYWVYNIHFQFLQPQVLLMQLSLLFHHKRAESRMTEQHIRSKLQTE